MIKNKKFIASCCCLLIYGLTKLYAQSGVVTSGGDATGAGGKVSYSTGQIDYIEETGNGGTVSQGLQQPYEILILTGKEQTGIQLTASVYPNPTVSFVTLNLSDVDTKNVSYELYDMQSKLIARQMISKKQTNISLSGLSVGAYFIKVFTNQTEIKVFKVIKNS